MSNSADSFHYYSLDWQLMTHTFGIGALFQAGDGCDLAFVQRCASEIEDLGFEALHVPDHVVTFERYRSRYPFTPDGQAPLKPNQPFLEPLLLLMAAASATRRLRLGTCIDLVAERHPLIRAKEIATLDVLCGGRFDYGVGVGWSQEEYEALGIPWERRGSRAVEHVQALRVAWTTVTSTFHGEFVSFDDVQSFPKPVQEPSVPVLFGGTTPAAIRRAVRHGEGWYAWWRPGDDAAELRRALDRELSELGRSPDDFRVVVGIPTGDSPEELRDASAAARELRASHLTLMTSLSPRSGIERLQRLASALRLT